MVETIAPVVHGGRNRRYWTALSLHVLGATASGALFGVLLALAGKVLGAPWGSGGLVLVAVVSGLYAARELFGAPIPLPDLDRQVPDWWRTFYSPNVAALLYGFGLGVGFFTFLTFGTYAAVAAGALASGSPALGGILMGIFGFARAIAIAAVSRENLDIIDTVERPDIRALGRYGNGAALLAAAVSALFAANFIA